MLLPKNKEKANDEYYKAKNKFTDITDSLNDVVKVIMRND